MSALPLSFPHRLLSRYGLLLFFLVGLPLATWGVWLLLPVVANYFGYDPAHSTFPAPLGP